MELSASSTKQLPDPVKGSGDIQTYQYASYPEPFEGLPKMRVGSKSTLFNIVKAGRLGVHIISEIIRQAALHTLPSWLISPLKPDIPTDLRSFEKLRQDLPFHSLNPALSENFLGSHKGNIASWAQHDDVFVEQFVAGINPVMIQRVMVNEQGGALLPEALNIDAFNKILTSINLSFGKSLSELAAGGRLFLVDYRILEGVPTKPGCVVYLPFVLFFLKLDGQLAPLGIQLTRNIVFTQRGPKASSNKVFSPHTGTEVASHNLIWKFAKLHVLHSDSLVHEAVTHLGYTHLAMEPVIIAFNRQLPDSHPILHLLTRHFWQTYDINQLGRLTLLSDNGQFERVTSLGKKVRSEGRKRGGGGGGRICE